MLKNNNKLLSGGLLYADLLLDATRIIESDLARTLCSLSWGGQDTAQYRYWLPTISCEFGRHELASMRAIIGGLPCEPDNKFGVQSKTRISNSRIMDGDCGPDEDDGGFPPSGLGRHHDQNGRSAAVRTASAETYPREFGSRHKMQSFDYDHGFIHVLKRIRHINAYISTRKMPKLDL